MTFNQHLEQILTRVLTASQRAASKYGPGGKDWMEKSEQFRQQEIGQALQAIDTLIREEIIGEDETTSVDGYDIRDSSPYSFRNHLRAEQRQLLEGSKE